ncbi:MAG: sensor histidine kinase [Lachnospiraceae bacterium]
MRKKQVIYAMLLSILALLLSFLTVTFFSAYQSGSQAKRTAAAIADYLVNVKDETKMEHDAEVFAGMSNLEITILDENTDVLYASQDSTQSAAQIADRQETKQAKQMGRGERLRQLSVSEAQANVARSLGDDRIVHVAITYKSVFMTALAAIVPSVLIFGILMLCTFFWSRRMTLRLVEPLNTLDLDDPMHEDLYPEISLLIHRMELRNQQINEKMQELSEAKEDYYEITENMQDGLIVTNQSVILSINHSALELFNIKREDCINKNILTLSRKENLKKCLDKALKGKSNTKTIEISGRNYQLLANPVWKAQEVQGAVIYILDVTEKEKNEQLRHEFSANVSHELKTPLMSISGYAELIKNGMVQQRDIRDFAERIYTEANRLTSMVNDIIKISQMDEGEDFYFESLELHSIAENVLMHLQEKAQERNITMHVSGEPAYVFGNEQLITEMIFNLCDNAIKYNRDGGIVEIEVAKKENSTVLIIKDSGIGIPIEEQERVFERFYRVEKSRSKEIEGTGLGLSIVKHGALVHRAEIQLTSIMGVGTAIEVTFPTEE